MAVFFVVTILLDKIFGIGDDVSYWKYFAEACVFALAMTIANVSRKHDWDTWSGLFRKFKKK